MTETVAGPGLLDLLRVAGALAIVLALALAAGVFVRRGGFGGARRGSLEIEERLSVARGVQLAVVRCGARRLLVGVSDKRVDLVAELDDEEIAAVEAVDTEKNEDGVRMPLGGFAVRLADALGRRGIAGRGA